MAVTSTMIGTKIIPLNDHGDCNMQFLFAEGQALSSEHIDEALIEGVIKGRVKLLVLIPEDFPVFLPQGGGSKILGEFYIGLLEPMLEKVRDALFPDLKPQANRDRIFEVGKSDDVNLNDIMSMATYTPWVTYDPLEQFLSDKLQVGLLHRDGTYTLAQYDDERMMIDTALSEAEQNKLFYVSNKYYKGLDAMFMANLKCGDRILAEQGSENVPEKSQGRQP